MHPQPASKIPQGAIWISRACAGLAFLLLLMSAGLTGCGGAEGDARADGDVGAVNEKTYKIVTTTGMIADIVRAVAGERAVVRSLMGEGVDPHLYRASRSDMSALLSADVVFYNGLNLEGKMTSAFEQVRESGRPVFMITERFSPQFLLAPPEFAGHHDPHVWMDPNGWMEATRMVVTHLSGFDPDAAAVYEGNGAGYIDQLRSLDQYARDAIATIPVSQRVLVTAHDAFNYFARAYDIEVQGIQGISTDSEAGLQRIELLVELIVSRRVTAVFTETSVSDQNIQALVQGAAARDHFVSIGGRLFSDAMGAPGTYEGTYLGMIDHNVTTIVRGLGGEAPERGMQDRLTGAGH